jgi:hypothetical protein
MRRNATRDLISISECSRSSETRRRRDGSFYFDQPNMLDQFLVNKNMAIDDALMEANVSTVKILTATPEFGMADPRYSH